MVVPVFSIITFEWDQGNRDKNFLSHRVTTDECEQMFFNLPFLAYDDPDHSQKEERWVALGITKLDRKLYIAFTMRDGKIRIISARDMDKNERHIYEQA